MKKISISLLFFLCLNLWAQQKITQTQKHGICSGYHKFWWTYKHTVKQYNDSDFSKEIWQNIDANFKGNAEYNEASTRTLTIINQAIQNKNYIVVKQFAGFCHELGIPIGQDLRQ